MGGVRGRLVCVAVGMVAVSAVVSCGGEEPKATTGGSTAVPPGPDGAGLATLPLVEPVPWPVAAVRPDGAFVISYRQPSHGEVEGAGLVTPSGAVTEVEVPEGLSGVAPVATASGFALFGYECLGGEDPDSGRRCRSIAGVVAFYDPTGELDEVVRMPPTQSAEALFESGSSGDGVVVTGDGAWIVTPEGPEAIDASGGVCGVGDDGILGIEPVSTDPEAPEDTLVRFDLRAYEDDGSWSTIEQVVPIAGGAPWPFCTPTGIVVDDKLFDGERLIPLDVEAQPAELHNEQTIGVTSEGTILQRQGPVPGRPPADEATGLPAWVGLSQDGSVALVAMSDGWEFVDVG